MPNRQSKCPVSLCDSLGIKGDDTQDNQGSDVPCTLCSTLAARGSPMREINNSGLHESASLTWLSHALQLRVKLSSLSRGTGWPQVTWPYLRNRCPFAPCRTCFPVLNRATDHHQPHPTATDASARMLSETLWPPSVECKINALGFKSLRIISVYHTHAALWRPGGHMSSKVP